MASRAQCVTLYSRISQYIVVHTYYKQALPYWGQRSKVIDLEVSYHPRRRHVRVRPVHAKIAAVADQFFGGTVW